MTPAQATPSCVVHDEAWISRLYHLKVDTTTRDGDGSPHEKPHKPLLLLAAFDLRHRDPTCV